MVIYLGADHRGFNLKEALKSFLRDEGYEVHDMGASDYNKDDDYVDFAVQVAGAVARDSEHGRGILICGSGTGMDIAANKFRGVRATLGAMADQVFSARHDDNANVLALAADFMSELEAKKMVKVFLQTPFGDEERYRRRLEKIANIESGSW